MKDEDYLLIISSYFLGIGTTYLFANADSLGFLIGFIASMFFIFFWVYERGKKA